MDELDKLFLKWKKRHSEMDYKRFIRDGIVDENWWLQEQAVPKICFFLKEARTEQTEGYNLVADLHAHYPWKLWQKVSIWTQAIQNAFISNAPYNEETIKKKLHESIKQIAVVNIKKSNGLAESDENDLKNYINIDKDLLLQELKIINPDIIVCGYTFGMLQEVLEPETEKNFKTTNDTMYGFWRDKLIIDYYHPACYYPNRVNYYALMSICKSASAEWEERKKIYASKTGGNHRFE